MNKHVACFLILCLGCNDPVDEQYTPPIEDAARVDVVMEPIPLPPDEEEAIEPLSASSPMDLPLIPRAWEASSVVPVRDILRGRTSVSERVIETRTTQVQMAPSHHVGGVDRSLSERLIIGDDYRLNEVTVLVLARIGVSECGWDPVCINDLRAIFWILRDNRFENETLINVMRNHSRIVSEVWVPTKKRQRWLVQLNIAGDYPSEYDGTEDTWNNQDAAKWRRMIGWARSLVGGSDTVNPCPIRIITWGGRCDVPGNACDDAGGRARGLIPVEVCGTVNRMWTSPSYFTPAVARREMRLAITQSRDVEPALIERFPEIYAELLNERPDTLDGQEGSALPEVGLESLGESPEASGASVEDGSTPGPTNGGTIPVEHLAVGVPGRVTGSRVREDAAVD